MYRTVQTNFWSDPDVRRLSTDGKLMKLYLVTNPHAHVSGIYYLPPATIAQETGIKIPHVNTLLNTLSHVKVDAVRMLVWVEKMLHYQARGEKAYRAAANQLTKLHNSPLLKDFLIGYPQVKRYCTKPFLDTLFGLGPLKEEEEEEKKLSPLSNSLSLLTSYSEDQVVNLWNAHSACPCKKVSGPIKKRLAICLSQHPEAEWWEALFGRVQQSDFLAGRAKDFVATLDWVLGPKNLAKIEAGNYDNRKSTGGFDAMKEVFLQS